MNCQPILTDSPGIFRCPTCGLQNPRPIAKPFIAICGPHEPPEPPYGPDTTRWILATICPPCPRYDSGNCLPDPNAPTKCGRGRAPMPIATMLERGACCPRGMF